MRTEIDSVAGFQQPFAGTSQMGIRSSQECIAVPSWWDGKPWKAETEAINRRVLYNPLNAQVQTELTQIVREVGLRYASHPSFRGLALETYASISLSVCW